MPRIYSKEHSGGWGANWFFFMEPWREKRRTDWWSRSEEVQCRKVTGHLTPLPRKGDEFQCKMQSGNIGRFVVFEVEYCVDPPDMFFAKTELRGYVE
jgi:hypothetical protein